jgi:hypothetical protein
MTQDFRKFAGALVRGEADKVGTWNHCKITQNEHQEMEIIRVCVLEDNSRWHKRPKKVDTFGGRACGSPADAQNVHGPDSNSLCQLEPTMMYVVIPDRGSRFDGARGMRRRGNFSHGDVIGEGYSSTVW